jgi:preprotein translocase subunit SecF
MGDEQEHPENSENQDFKDESTLEISEESETEQNFEAEPVQEDEKVEEKIEKPKEQIQKHHEKPSPKIVPEKPKKHLKETIINFYDTQYRKLLYVTLAIFVISLVLIGVQIAATGDFVRKDISLTGGTTITLLNNQKLDIVSIENYLNSQLPGKDFSVRRLTQTGTDIGIIIDGPQFDSNEVIRVLSSKIGNINKDDYTVTMMGSSLGSTFFKETLKAIYISFLFMGAVVFLYFGESLKHKILTTSLTIIAALLIFVGSPNNYKDIVAYLIGFIVMIIYYKNSTPSFMMIVNVFADLTFTLAVVNLIGIKVSTAGIASFLMIIGYCVESNILLTTKLVKERSGILIDRLINCFKTGFLMTATAISAVSIALILTQSSVIKEIMAILLIGLIADLIFTWLQNVAMLRIYLEKKQNGLQN